MIMENHKLICNSKRTRQPRQTTALPAQSPFPKKIATRARLGDEYPIAKILLDNAPVCLPVSPAKLVGCLPFYRVFHKGQRIVGTFALFPINSESYELRSVAVAEDERGNGLGRQLVSMALERAARERKRVYCVTTKPEFFTHFGFREMPFCVLPPKPERKLFPSEGPSISMYWDDPNHSMSQNSGEWNDEDLRFSA